MLLKLLKRFLPTFEYGLCKLLSCRKFLTSPASPKHTPAATRRLVQYNRGGGCI